MAPWWCPFFKRLCAEADKELKSTSIDSASSCTEITKDVGGINFGWNEGYRISKVRSDDFIIAAKKNVPMVNEEDLKKFDWWL